MPVASVQAKGAELTRVVQEELGQVRVRETRIELGKRWQTQGPREVIYAVFVKNVAECTDCDRAQRLRVSGEDIEAATVSCRGVQVAAERGGASGVEIGRAEAWAASKAAAILLIDQDGKGAQRAWRGPQRHAGAYAEVWVGQHIERALRPEAFQRRDGAQRRGAPPIVDDGEHAQARPPGKELKHQAEDVGGERGNGGRSAASGSPRRRIDASSSPRAALSGRALRFMPARDGEMAQSRRREGKRGDEAWAGHEDEAARASQRGAEGPAGRRKSKDETSKD